VKLPDAVPRRPLVRLTFVCALCLPGLSPTVTAQHADQEMDRAQAESHLERVLQEISRLTERLESARTEHRQEQSRLHELDQNIQQADRQLRALREQQEQHQRKLQSAQNERDAYLHQIQRRMNELGEQLRWSYLNSRQSRIRMVLNQDDPASLGLMLAYYDYLARAEASRISSLKEVLTTLEVMQKSIDQALLRVEQLTAEQQAIVDQLGGQRDQRQALLARLEQQIGNEASQLRELERNRQDLETLIERLADVLADIPAGLGDEAGIEQQKGRLPMPVSGPVKEAYGQNRGGGLHWQGWLIGAEPGTEVYPVAYGRVAFADWLRGYGLLVIIDHGRGYMSLYGHNESILHEAGTWVAPGEVISVVGSNPGSGQGLYFELRKGGKAVDPAAWLAR